jgi:hypothetical protein
MTLRQALPLLAGGCAGLLLQACVEYLPENDPLQAGGPPAAVDASPGAPPTPPPTAPAQAYAPPTPPPPQPPGPYDALVAPIALYPDPLISVLLPAATFPDQITAAANYLVQYGDPTQIANQPWDPSVRALAHYPAVVAWMAQNLPWTEALGTAFASAPAAVMDSIQGLRARAQAAGTLRTTPQQQVVNDDGGIDIVPAQPDVIYVPVYDPNIVFDEGGYYDYNGPFINFGDPCPVGIWLDFGFDWRRHQVWQGSPYYWRNGAFGAGRGGPPPGSRPWHPPAGGGLGPPGPTGSGPRVAPAPRPMPGAPNPPPSHYRVPPTVGGTFPGTVPGGGPVPQPRPRLVPPATAPVTGIVTPRSPAPVVGGEGVRAAPPLEPAPTVHYAPAPASRPAAPRASYQPVETAPATREGREAPAARSESPAPAARAEPAHEVHESRAPAAAPQSSPPAPAQSQPNNQPPR